MKLWIFTCYLIKSLFSQVPSEMEFLYPAIEQLTVRVPIGRHTQIDSLENQGQTIRFLMKYHGEPFYDHPCRGIPSRISFSKHQELQVIEGYSESQFFEILQDGHFNQTIESIIDMVPIDNGFVLITNKPAIIIIKINIQQRNGQIFQFENREFKTTINLDTIQGCSTQIDKNYIQYFKQTKTVYILSCNKLLFFQVNIDELEFQNKTSFNSEIGTFYLKEASQVNPINLFQISQNYAYIGFKNSHLGIYKINDKDMVEVGRLNSSVIDIKFVLQEDNITENLYVLDQQNGLRFYELINDTVPHIRIRNIPFISFSSGIALDIYGNTLIMLSKENDVYFVNDYHIEENSWYLLNTWVIDSIIRDVKVTKDFAILLGDSGHYILYHSINHNYFYKSIMNYERYERQPFFFRGAHQIDFFTDDLFDPDHKQIIFGFSNHKFMMAKWNFKPFSIICYSNEDKHVKASPLLLDFNLTSTQCKEKIDKENDFQACVSNIQYKIYFYHTLLTTKQSFWIIVFAFIIVIIFFFFGLVLLKKYLTMKKLQNYQSFNQQVAVEITDLKYVQVSGKTPAVNPQYDGNQIESPNENIY